MFRPRLEGGESLRGCCLCFQQQSHACQDPFGCLLSALQPEGPDVVGAPRFGFVDRACVGLFGFLSVRGYGFREDDRHH